MVNKYFGVIVDMLMAAGADVNAESGSAERGNAGDGSVLAEAAKSGSTATVAKLISAGARHLNQVGRERTRCEDRRDPAVRIRRP